MNLTTRIRLRLEREAHRLRFHGQTVSLEALLHQAAGRNAPSLAVPAWRTISNGRRLYNSSLAETLAQEEFGTWALDVPVLNFLEREIQTHRPVAILEFGAGLSTVCLAQYQAEVWGRSSVPRVFSVEQNEWQVEKSRQQLTQLGLAESVRILHAPISPQVIEGVSTLCYDLAPPVLDDFFQDALPAFVLIDGPSGDDDTRFGTLPLVRGHVSGGARFYLDDALRPEELAVAGGWRGLPYLSLSSVRLLGKGLLTGQFISAEQNNT